MIRSFSILAISAGVAIARPAPSPAHVARQEVAAATTAVDPAGDAAVASATPEAVAPAEAVSAAAVDGAVTVGDILNQKALVVDSDTVSLDPSNCLLTSYEAVHVS